MGGLMAVQMRDGGEVSGLSGAEKLTEAGLF